MKLSIFQMTSTIAFRNDLVFRRIFGIFRYNRLEWATGSGMGPGTSSAAPF